MVLPPPSEAIQKANEKAERMEKAYDKLMLPAGAQKGRWQGMRFVVADKKGRRFESDPAPKTSNGEFDGEERAGEKVASENRDQRSRTVDDHFFSLGDGRRFDHRR